MYVQIPKPGAFGDLLWHPMKSTKPNIEVEQVEQATRESLALSLNVSIDQIQAPRVAKLEMSVLVGERVVHLLLCWVLDWVERFFFPLCFWNKVMVLKIQMNFFHTWIFQKICKISAFWCFFFSGWIVKRHKFYTQKEDPGISVSKVPVSILRWLRLRHRQNRASCW